MPRPVTVEGMLVVLSRRSVRADPIFYQRLNLLLSETRDGEGRFFRFDFENNELPPIVELLAED